MLMKNYAGRVLKIVSLKVSLEPGETAEIDDGYCLPRRASNGSRIASTVEELAPGIEPADEKIREEWKKTPTADWEPPKVVPTVEELQSAGMPPGVAAIVAEKKAAEVAVLQEAKPEPKKYEEEEKEKPAKRRGRRKA